MLQNPCIFGVHYIIEIFSIFFNVHIVLRNQKKTVFYVNYYIDQDQFNYLYKPGWLEKDI